MFITLDAGEKLEKLFVSYEVPCLLLKNHLADRHLVDKKETTSSWLDLPNISSTKHFFGEMNDAQTSVGQVFFGKIAFDQMVCSLVQMKKVVSLCL